MELLSALPVSVVQYASRALNIARPDPATLEELGTVPEMGLSETMEAIEAASKAFPAWSRTTAKVSDMPYPCLPTLTIPHQHRHDILMKLFALMQEHHDDLGRIIVCTPCITLSSILQMRADPGKRETTCGGKGKLDAAFINNIG